MSDAGFLQCHLQTLKVRPVSGLVCLASSRSDSFNFTQMKRKPPTMSRHSLKHRLLKCYSEKEVFNVDRFIGTSVGLALLPDLSISFPVTAVETEDNYPPY